MTATDDRITALQTQIDRLEAEQCDLRDRLAEARVEQWQGRMEDLELQTRLASMEVDDKVASLLEDLHARWMELRFQLDRSRAAAVDVVETVKEGAEGAIRTMRDVLQDAGDMATPQP